MDLLKIGTGERFLSFTNADGKTWYIPERNAKTALCLYQPSGWKGKLLKRHLNILQCFEVLGRILHVEKTRCELAQDFKALLCSLYNVADIEFSVFLGTPSVHQKTTIQLSSGKKILGYCKVTDKKEVAELFNREAETLKRLQNNGIEGIPQCLFSGEWKDGVYLFSQTTEKTPHSTVPHQWSDSQDAFLKELHEKTKRKIVFEGSDLYRSLMSLKEHSDWLPDAKAKETVVNAIEKVLEENGGKTVEYSVYHGDFTPWNMFIESGNLFVFDWEYSKALYPPFLDRYHYFMQTAIFERHKDAKEIISMIHSDAAQWMSQESLRYYLLDIISRFTVRERGVYSGDVERMMNIWLKVMK